MKQLYLLASCFLLAATAQAQTAFWTEDFGTGCNRGQLATAYTGSNGAWTIASTGTNGNVANNWFISSTCDNTGAGNCSDNCSMGGGTNATLHVSNSQIVIPSFYSVAADTGASYLTGGFSSFGYVATTNARVESPVINCTGETNISVSFIYLENGQTTLDDAQLVYSADGGSTWTMLDPLAKTTGCTAGQWTSFSIALPASADNNSTVKIGFTWTNNDDGQGSDPSFAVDDIALTSNPLGVAALYAGSVNVFANAQNEIIIDANGHDYNMLGITDILGRPVNYTQTGNRLHPEAVAAGIYIVNFEMNGQRVARKVMMQ